METVLREELVGRVRGLVDRRGPRCGPVTVVAVDGPSGSGKTTLADELARGLGARLLHVDDMHQGWTGLAGTVAIARDSLVQAWQDGSEASHPTWDWEASARGADVPVDAPRLVVLEGVGAFAIAGDRASASVWVQAPAAERRARAIGRDGEVFASHWDEWADQ